MRSLHPRSVPHVAVCVDKARSYGCGVLRGIADYVEAFGPWSLFIDPQAMGKYEEHWLDNWRGDGVLAYIEDAGIVQRLRQSGIPAVELFGHRADLGLPQVGNDDVAIGRLSFGHLAERQFRHFAFSGYLGELWVARRFQGFSEAARQAGKSVSRFECSRSLRNPTEWEDAQQSLTQWLCQLPKPVGLMACSDRHAQRVLDACRRAAMAVPEEIAVVGVDNDEEICRLSNPPLSSVMDDPRRIGYEAARLLDRLMHGQQDDHSPATLLIPPIGIVTRISSDITATEDRLVALAVQTIRRHACELTTAELVRRLHVSRSVLYRRFHSAIRRTPHEEILRIRLERVKALLYQTTLTLEQIAERTGFHHPEYLSVAFKREIGISPAQFRKSNQRTY